MIQKRLSVLLLFALTVGFLVTVHAADPLGVQNGVQQLQDTQESINEIRYNYLAEGWKDLLLQKPFFANLNDFFTKINPLFAIVFARDWSFSLATLFACLLWIFTFISLTMDFSAWFKNVGYQFLFSLLGTVLIAHIQIYNALAAGAVKLVFYRQSFAWSIASLFITIMLMVMYLYINKIISKRLKQARELRKKKDNETRLKVLEEFNRNMGEGL